MRIDLESEEGRFLHAQLKRRISDLELDVEHADDKGTQHALLAEIARLEAIVMHVEGALEVAVGADARVSFETRM